MTRPDFPDLQSSRKRSSLVDHLTIVSVFALTLAVFHVSDDPDTGRGSMSDGIRLAVAFLGVAYYVGWLPSLWEASQGKWSAALVLPGLIAVALCYLYLLFRTYYIQGPATVEAFFAHLIALIVVSFRT